MKTLRIVLVVLVALAVLLSGSAPTTASSGTTERVSVSSDENEANGSSRGSSISANGRYVAFWSYATNLVPDDTNESADVFVRDRLAGTTERVSVDSDENEANGQSHFPAISADGRYVAFWSYASNLVADDTNERDDIFVRDRLAGTTERVSVDSDGNEANENSTFPAISAGGRYVAFPSFASNLVPNDTNSLWDVFVHDRITGTTQRVSVDSDGNEGNDSSSWVSPGISPDGRYVAFASQASNLVLNDTNEVFDIFVRDLLMGKTERVSVDSDGNESDDWSCFPVISWGGGHVAFWSNATNLVAADTNALRDVFARDRLGGTTEGVSVDSDGNQGSGDMFPTQCTLLAELDAGAPAISQDGRYVAFSSEADDLVPDDTNEARDVFVRDRGLMPSVGGVAELPEATDSSTGSYIVLAGLAAAAVAALTAGAWYGRRRRLT